LRPHVATSPAIVWMNNCLNAACSDDGGRGPGSEFATRAYVTDCVSCGPHDSMPSPPPLSPAVHAPNPPPNMCSNPCTDLYHNQAGSSTIDSCAICRGPACTRAGCNSMTADDGLRKGARQVFEIALEELCIEGKLWDADVRYLLPHEQRNADEDTTDVPVEQAADLDGAHLLWVACFYGALVLLRLGLLVFAVCSEQERSGRGERFAIWARHNRSYRNKWFKLALLALLVPRSTDAQTYFTVSSGPCTVDPSSPNCIRSPNFPSSYQDNQACTITPTALAIGDPLKATSFSTEACCDRLSIPSYPSGTVTAFSGSERL